MDNEHNNERAETEQISAKAYRAYQEQASKDGWYLLGLLILIALVFWLTTG